MDKKKAIVNTLMGKLQSRSKKLFEDVSNEIWNDIPMEDADKDFDIEVDGEEIKTEDDDTSAIDVLLGAQEEPAEPKEDEEEHEEM
jgi:hypothetical protein